MELTLGKDDTEALKGALNPEKYRAQANKIIKYGISNIAEKSQRLCPFDTHNLQRSMRVEVDPRALEGKCGYTAEYAGYVEKGTRYMDAQPYLAPAVREVKPEFLRDMGRLNELVK